MIQLNLKPKLYKPFIAPTLVFLTIIILTFTLGNYLLNNLLQTRQDISNLKQKNQLLEQKKQLLSSLNESELNTFVQSAITAVPPDNSTLMAMSTLRVLASTKGVEISNLRVNLAGKSFGGKNTAEINFSIRGGLGPTLSFLDDIKKVAPLMRISEADFDISGGAALASFLVLSPWEVLPEKLGAIEAPVETLTQSDRKLIESLSVLKGLGISQVSTVPAQGRTNPFTF